MDKRPLARIILRHVADEARLQHAHDQYYPSCRGASRHAAWPHWNLRFEYRVQGGGQSFYWCDGCLPAKYREVADSMIRGGEKARIIKGAAAEGLRTPPPVARREPGSTIPWRSLL